MKLRHCLLILLLAIAANADDAPIPAFATAKEALSAARTALKEKDVAAAKIAYDAMVGLATTPVQIIDARMLQAEIAVAGGNRAHALGIYAEILRDTELKVADRLRAGTALAALHLANRSAEETVEVYAELIALPELSERDVRSVKSGLAAAYARFGADAIWQDGDYPAAIAHAQNAIAVARDNGGAGFPIALLKRLATHCRGQQLNAGVITSCSAILAEPKSGTANRAWAIPILAEAQLGSGDPAAAVATLTAGNTDTAFTVKQRLPWATALVALQAAIAERDIDLAVFRTFATEAEATAEESLEAASFAATCLNAGGYYPQCRQVLAMTDQMVETTPHNTITCTFSDEAPLGAAGWLLSPLARDPATGARRFAPYDTKEVARLISDITTAREAGAPEKLAPYLAATSFSMLYDANGWHIFVLSGEPDAARIVADGRSAGALELAVQPGSDSTYYQWIIDLPSGKASSFDWNSPNPTFRPLADFMTTSTVRRSDEFGTYIYIPWETFYDRLPVAGDTWKFGFIRWTPGGGLTWGGRVHELSQFGDVKWAAPTPDQRAAIQRNILRKAWGRFTATSLELTLHWQDREIGDPDYFKALLEPELIRLKELGNQMTGIDTLSADQVETLYQAAVSRWMDLDYYAQRIRHAYLLDGLTRIVPAAY